MASGGKKKTTMAKLARESRLRERRLEKKARKDARKLATGNDTAEPGDPLTATSGESAPTDAGQPTLETAVRERADA